MAHPFQLSKDLENIILAKLRETRRGQILRAYVDTMRAVLIVSAVLCLVGAALATETQVCQAFSLFLLDALQRNDRTVWTKAYFPI